MGDSKPRTIITIGIVIFIILLFILGIIFAIRTIRNIFSGVNVRTGTTTVTTNPTIPDDSNTINTVKPREDQYSGNVRFAATVDTVIGVKAFTVRDTGIFKDGLLIITDGSIAPIGAKTIDQYLIHSGDRLLISGAIDQFNSSNFRSNFNGSTPTVNLESFNGQAVVSASDVKRIQ